MPGPGSNSVVVVTGANRGIGLGLCRSLQAQGHTVLAACRSESEGLLHLAVPQGSHGLAAVEIISGVDVVTELGCSRLSEAVSLRQVDLLILNAGHLQKDELSCLDFDSIQKQFEVNALGPLRVVAALRNHLRTGSKVVLISSKMGSLTSNVTGGMYGYRMSKAAANMAVRSIAMDLRNGGVVVAMLHPGAVVTELYHGYHRRLDKAPEQVPQPTSPKTLTVEESVQRLLGCIDRLTLDTTGRFWTAEDGAELAW